MLREIHIRNFSIIDDLSAEFSDGFNVLTGETGSGKSIIIDALSLSLGERAAGEFIRSGEKEAVIEAFFDPPPEAITPSVHEFLSDNSIDINDGIILKRIISAKGRNRAYINGSMVNLQNLSDISSAIIDVHGQYEHQSLLSSTNQLELLDAYGGLTTERKKVEYAYTALTSLKGDIERLLSKDRERAQRLDMLRYQVSEIKAAELRVGEEEELIEEEKILGSSVRLAELANQAYESLYSSDSSSIGRLSDVIDKMKEIAGIDGRASDALKSLEEALPLLEESGYFLRDYKESMEFDPGRLEAVQERVELINRLKRKYGGSVREIIEYLEKSEAELEDIENSEERLESLNKELDRLKSELTNKAGKLSEKRKKVSKKIESEVINQLKGLSMPHTNFKIQIEHEEGDDTADGMKATSTGIDRIEFLIAPNIGEDLKPLTKIASGGELSRIMLALKVILAKGDRMPVLVFDEIDSGIGGKAAETVGKKLKGLSKNHQVICITHLPQIASYADGHLRIEKKVKGKRTKVDISAIERNERTEEIARMLSGDISKASLGHARELLEKSAR